MTELPPPSYELVDAEGIPYEVVYGGYWTIVAVPWPWPIRAWRWLTRWKPCRTYWGSHGCDLRRGHRGSHVCDCCECDSHPDPDSGCVGRAPYYGDETRFYGEDVDGWENPVTLTRVAP